MVYLSFSEKCLERRWLCNRRLTGEIAADVGRGASTLALAVDQIPVLEQRDGGGHVSDEGDAVIADLLRELGYHPISP